MPLHRSTAGFILASDGSRSPATMSGVVHFSRSRRVKNGIRSTMAAPAALVALGMLAACGGGDGPTNPPANGVATILVDFSPTSIIVGQKVQATATAFDSKGNALPSTTFTWSSSAPAVATVDQTGLITAVAAGTATIRAKAGTKTGESDVAVDVDRCTTPLNLAVGEARSLSGPTAVSCVTIAASQPASEFLFISANALPSQDDLRSYTVSGGATASTNIVASGMASAPQAALAQPDAQDVFEQRVRAAETRLLARRSPGRMFRTARQEIASGVSASVSAAFAKEGDTLSLTVPNTNPGKDICKDGIPVRAVVMKVGQRVQLVQDIASPASGFTPTDFQEIADEFDNLIFRTDTLWFGSPTDVNADGKITVLYTPEINKLTPAGSTGFVGGFFFGADLFPKSIPAENYSCPASNFQEIFYLLVADPLGTINNNRRTTADVRQGTRGTIAHEFQHMINQSVRMTNNADQLEVSWMNEALSHFAEEVVGRASRGFGDFQQLAPGDLTANTNDFNAFFRQNLLRFRTWMLRPDTASPISAKASSQLAPRGAGWALVRYATDHYANGSARTFTRRVVAGPGNDVPNLVAAAGAPFEDILNGYLVANYTTGLGVSNLAQKYSYRSWSMRDVMSMSGVSNGTFPLLVTPLPTQVTTQSLSGSGNYFRLVRGANAPQATFRMLSTSGTNVDFSSARVYVVRVN
jgi:Big-like domain-containing protein